MSFSFSIRVKDKAQVLAQVSAKLDEIVAAQPAHALDREQVLTVAKTMLAVVADNPSKDLFVGIHGSVMIDAGGNCVDVVTGFECHQVARIEEPVNALAPVPVGSGG